MNSIQKVRSICLSVFTLGVFALFGMMPNLASAQPTLSSDVGVDIGAWIAVVAAAVGTVIASVLAVFFLIMVIRIGLGWISKMFNG